MKKKLLLFAILFASFNLFSQIDIKINTIGLLYYTPDLGVEFGVSDNFGVELSFGLNYGGTTTVLAFREKTNYDILAAGKYYFKQNKKCNRFFAGAYLKHKSLTFNFHSFFHEDISFDSSVFSGGGLIGYKWVLSPGILFESAFGLGRNFKTDFSFTENNLTSNVNRFGIDGVWRLSVGYRLGGRKN